MKLLIKKIEPKKAKVCSMNKEELELRDRS